jgi:hypothetical protein
VDRFEEVPAMIAHVSGMTGAPDWPPVIRERFEAQKASILSRLSAITDYRAIPDIKADLQLLTDISKEAIHLKSLTLRLEVAVRSLSDGKIDAQAQASTGEQVRQIRSLIDAGSTTEAASLLDALDREIEFIKSPVTLRIVDRPGIRSGQDRLYTDANGARVSGYYLIVEAVTPTGRVLTMPIRNEEDGRSYMVNMWGERVPKVVYDRVKADKTTDGRVDDNVFAVKPSGTSRLTYEMIPKPAGQITRW